MARHKEFDHDQVLDQAMRVFWRQGYEATSVEDLVAATGINRASMYNTFGDKRGLFLAAVDHYLAQVIAERLAILLDPKSAKQAIRRYFEGVLSFSLGEGRRLGCLLTNSAVEMAPRDGFVGERLRQCLAQVEDAFLEVIQRGQTQGEIGAGKDPRALARFLMGAVQGLRVLARADADEATLRDVVDVTLAALD